MTEAADAPVRARVVHRTADRLRLKLAVEIDLPRLSALADALIDVAGVTKVDARPVTGSIVLSIDGPADDVEAAIEASGAVAFHDPPAEDETAMVSMPVWAIIAKAWVETNPAATGLAALAVLQMARGPWLPPAATLLWYAAELGGLTKPKQD